MPQSGGPLSDIRVLEFSQIVAGPVAGLNLADLGADVIKIEPPSGDPHRFVGTTVPGEAKMYQGNNRGKRGAVIDLQDPRGRALIHRLMPTVDAVIINYRLGVARRNGIDYETLKAFRPDLIYAQISGFGEKGPLAGRGGADIVGQAHSGLMAMDGKSDENGTPQLVSIPLSDYAAGLSVAMAVSAAIRHRDRTGEGQYISTSLLRAGLHLQNRYVMREPVSDAELRDPVVERLGEARRRGAGFPELAVLRNPRASLASPFTLYYRAYQTKEGFVVIGALTPRNRNAARRALGIEGEDSDSPDFDARDPANIEAVNRWKARLEALMRTKTAEEWLAILEPAGVPVARVNFPEEMADDPQANADDMIWELEHTVTGPQRVVGPNVLMSATPTGSRRAAPSLGEHTAEILREIGVTRDEMEELSAAGVISLFS
ncbi:MAG: CaiB/BaiF CoA transferase family protein [Dehalococcoidia bacterium]